MIRWRQLAVFVLLLALPLASSAQRLGDDPLNEKEADELRDTAQMPNHRLRTFVRFLQGRMAEIERLQADPKAEKRPRQILQLLQDIATLSDELDENMTRYAGEGWDIRKSLKYVVEGQNEIYLKLRAMLDAPATDSKLRAEADEYRFALRDAIESLRSSLDSARSTVLDQARAAKDKRLKRPEE